MQKLKAIAVDDSELMLFIIESFLSELGIVFESFTDPLDALEKMSEDDVDIIFVDYMMPQMNGIEFVKSVRKNNSKIPIVMITSSQDFNLKEQAHQAGVDDFVSIPFNPAEFKLSVNNVIEKRKCPDLV